MARLGATALTAHAADKVVTMTQTGRSRVLDSYGTSPGKVSVIPHGAAGTLAASLKAAAPGPQAAG